MGTLYEIDDASVLYPYRQYAKPGPTFLELRRGRGCYRQVRGDSDGIGDDCLA